MSRGADEQQAAIDAAEHDGEGWGLGPDLPLALLDSLARQGLARRRHGRWQLTPQGFARTTRFKAIT